MASAISTRTSTVSLTTVFTPPSDCSTKFTYEAQYYNSINNGLLIQNALATAQMSSCFPSGFYGYGRVQSIQQVFSPGACPSGYTTPALFQNNAVTTAICCPSKFSYYTTYSTVNAGLSSSVLFDGCVSQFPSASTTTVVARANNQDLNTTVAGGNGPITMWAQPLTVQFQSSDLSLYATASSTSSSATTTRSGDVSAASATTGSTASLSSASQTSSASATASSSPGLSTGAQAGIGVGVSLGALAVMGAVIAWWLLRRRKNKAAVVGPANGGYAQDMSQHHPYELDGNARSEMDGLPQQPVHKKTPMSPVEMGS